MTYPLKRLPPKLWAQAKQKAAREGHTMRWVLLRLLEAYVAER